MRQWEGEGCCTFSLCGHGCLSLCAQREAGPKLGASKALVWKLHLSEIRVACFSPGIHLLRSTAIKERACQQYPTLCRARFPWPPLQDLIVTEKERKDNYLEYFYMKNSQ